MRKIFLLGSSSYLIQEIGRYLLKDKKYEVIFISRKKINKFENSKHYKTDYSTTSISKIFKKELNKKAHKPIIIFGNVITQSELFINIDEKFINNIINVNIILPIRVVNIVLKNYFRASPIFFNISSIRVNPSVGTSIYGSSKLFMENFFGNLALEYGNMDCIFKSIRIGISDGGLAKTLSDKVIKAHFQRLAKKDFVKPLEIYKTIEFELERSSSNGKVVYCDNGYF